MANGLPRESIEHDTGLGRQILVELNPNILVLDAIRMQTAISLCTVHIIAYCTHHCVLYTSLYTVHIIAYCTHHCALYTSLYTVHNMRTVHITVYCTHHFILYTSLNSVHITVYCRHHCVLCTSLNTVQWTVYSVQCTHQCVLYTSLYTVHITDHITICINVYCTNNIIYCNITAY